MKRLFVLWGSAWWLLMGCGERLEPVQTLLPVGAEPQDQLQAIWFGSPDTGYVAGGQRFLRTALYATTDGGQQWTPQFPELAFDKILFDLDFVDSRRGFAAGFDGKVLRTLDGGQTWRVSQIPFWYPMRAIKVVNDSLVIAVGGVGYSTGIIARSTNFGESWTVIDILELELRDVVFTSATTGYACGYGAILQTTDGGLTWTYTPARNEFFSALCFVDAQTGFAVGRTGTILRTTDAGASWERLRNGNLPGAPHRYHDVAFIDAQVGYIVGDRGLILKTRDGGRRWTRFDRQLQADLYAVQVWPDGEGIIAGAEGTLFRFSE